MSVRRGTVAPESFTISGLPSKEEALESGQAKIVLEQIKPDERRAPLRKPGRLLGSVLWEGDIVSPLDETWDAES